ncbi:MAG TPA: tail fiber domain-containing protein [Flavobacterium sp.]|uniref:tail fiber domain-containing protein n=1 Tax=unclassified Flavobacterium TaxID=196869 RepID=UPI0025B86873|nr:MULTISPECIES: tail fiber domain-containing protein [unclassified Flavobacterium]HRE77636.1 tail fiber domain-containing protein [Flavobacterium sp.]
MKKLIFYFFVLFSTSLFAQVGINTTTPNAQLDIRSSNQVAPTSTDGMLIPKIDTFPATNPAVDQQGMLVYLTTNVGSNQPGFYYWDNVTTSWISVKGTDGGTLDQAYDFGGPGNGRTITADAGAVTINGTDGLVSTGTLSSGEVAPSGAGTRMVWNPRKAAFRAGRVTFDQWDDTNIGESSTAFGSNSIASGVGSFASGQNAQALGSGSTAFGSNSIASGVGSFASGQHAQALGSGSTAFGIFSTASGFLSFSSGLSIIASGSYSAAFGETCQTTGLASYAFGRNNVSSGNHATTFGFQNISRSYGEVVIGIGATIFNPSINGNTQFRLANANDRLFVIGNAIDADNDDFVDNSERSDAMIVLKSGLTRLPSTTNTMIDAADGKAVVTKEYLQSNTSGTLDQAYDFEGGGNGRTITADAGAVLIDGTDGLVSTGTLFSGSLSPSGAGVKMFWNPRKAAFRAGEVFTNEWDDANVGIKSVAMGHATRAFGAFSTAFGNDANANGGVSTAFGINTDANGNVSTVFGRINLANGDHSFVAGRNNFGNSYAETIFGIGATTYATTTNGSTQFRSANATDRLFVIGNAIDTNNNNTVDASERSDAMIVLKSGLTRLPSTTNTMIDAADGKAVVTKEYLQSSTSGTLDQAYDFGGAGNGRTITADNGAVTINGTDGLVSSGTAGVGAISPSGAGTRMVWNPRKSAFRAGRVSGTEWDDVNVGDNSIAMGFGTRATGNSCIALGSNCSASGLGSVAFGWFVNANATQSTAFGLGTNTNNVYSTAFGYQTSTSGRASTSFGVNNEAESFGEVVLGIGATTYTPSTNGANQFRIANATDRLLVVGNAIDADNDDVVDNSERSNALVILKNGNTGIGSSTPGERLHVAGRTLLTNGFSATNAALLYQNNADYMFLGPQSGSSANGGAMALYGSTNASGGNAGGIDFNTNSGLVRLTSVGNLGVGTNNPLQKLHVSGPAGLTAIRIGNTSLTGTTSNVAIDFLRGGNANTDWRIFNIGANLTLGNSADDLATINNLYQFQGSRFMPMTDATISLGQTANRWNTLFASNGTINTSDEREKKNIQNLNYGLTTLMQLRPVSFEWKKDDGSGTKLGLIAQELQQVVPEVVRDWDWEEDEQGNRKKVASPILGVYYSDLIPVLIKATQEQQLVIEQQKEEINLLKQQLQEQYKSIVERLEKIENK